MHAEDWQRLSPLLDELLELAPAERAQRLTQLRAQDAALADALGELLRLEATHDDFLAEPAVAGFVGPVSQSEIGPYRLERMLGEGGMGQVWLASRADGLYERRVALKLLRPGIADPNLRLRFTRERQILARLAHPHVAGLLDAGISADAQPYLALEYVDGEPITDWCRARKAALPVRLRLFLQVCEAVSHAHANLIVHRDLKPSNILVTPLQEARLLDFGIAKLLDSGQMLPEHTRTGMRAFTLHYAAPEQIRGEPVSTMTDVYALGVVLYELLTDARPYQLKRKSDAEWEEAILHGEPLRPSHLLQRQADACEDRDTRQGLRRRARMVAGDLDNIVLKALSKTPEARYPSVEAFALDLHRYNAGKPVLARGHGATYRLWKALKRHRWAYATGAAVLTVIALSLGIVLWQAQQAMRENRRAQALQDFVVSLFEEAGRSPDGGDAVDMRTLLAAGAARGARELAQQPEARAELYGLIAKLQLGLGDTQQAQLLLQRQQGILDALPNPPPALRLDATTQSARIELLLGHAQRCAERLAPLERLALLEQSQHPAQAAAYFAQYGQCERLRGASGHARVLLRRALVLQRTLGDRVAMKDTANALAGLETQAP